MDFLPLSIKASTDRLLKNSPDEESKNMILKTFNENIRKFKKMKIDDLLDGIKDHMDEESFAVYRKEVNEMIFKNYSK